MVSSLGEVKECYPEKMTSAVTQRECVKVQHYDEESVYQAGKAAAWGGEHLGFQKHKLNPNGRWTTDCKTHKTEASPEDLRGL